MQLDGCPGNENKIFNMDEEAVGAADSIVTEFSTYEDFLDSQITPLDLYYLEVRLIFTCGTFWVEFASSLRQIKLVPMRSLNNCELPPHLIFRVFPIVFTSLGLIFSSLTR